MTSNSESAPACNLFALTAEQRDEHRANATWLWRRLLERTSTDDGVAIKFPHESEFLPRLARFVELEHLCCPFFTLEIRLTRDDELWLHFTGNSAVAHYARDNIPSSM